MQEIRCINCDKLLCKFDEESSKKLNALFHFKMLLNMLNGEKEYKPTIEIKCPRCGAMNCK